MNGYRRYKLLASLFISVFIVLSGVVVNYSSQDGLFLQVGQEVQAASGNTLSIVNAQISSSLSYLSTNYGSFDGYFNCPNIFIELDGSTWKIKTSPWTVSMRIRYTGNSGVSEFSYCFGASIYLHDEWGGYIGGYNIMDWNDSKFQGYFSKMGNSNIGNANVNVDAINFSAPLEIAKAKKVTFSIVLFSNAYYAGINGGGSNDVVNEVPYVWNTAPTLASTSPSQNETFSAQKPTMTLSGTLYDPDAGDSETVYYRIDGSAGQAGTAAATLTANNSNQGFSASINVGSSAEGTHNIYVWAEDNYGGKSAESCRTFKVDKTPPIVNTPTLIANSFSQIIVYPNAADPVVSSVNSGLHSTPYIYNRNGTDITTWQADSYPDSGLTPNTQYTYKYLARDLVDNVSGYSASVSKYTLAAVPAVSVSGVTSYTMDLGISDANPTGTPYQIMVGSNYVTSTGTLSSAAQWITLQNKKITVTGLSPNTTYNIKAKAINFENVETGYSSSASGTTLVAPPSTPAEVSVAAATTTSIKAVWNVVSGATSYDIAVDGSTASPQNVTTNSYNVSGLSAGTSHTISIRAKNGGNPSTSSWSTPITVWTLPAAPTGLTATPASNSISLFWNGVTGATGYYISIDNGTEINNDTATTYNNTGNSPNSVHTYKVRAKNLGGNGDYSSTINSCTLSNIPSKGNTGARTNTSIPATWQSNGNPEGTQYSLAAFDQNGILIKQNAWTTSLSDTITGLTPDTSYNIKVQARNKDGKATEWLTISASATTLPNAPSIPTGVTATTINNSSIKIAWTYITGLTYDVKRNGVLAAQNLTAASFTDTGLAPETTYKYSVQAKNAGGSSGFSTEISQTTLPNVPVVPTGISSTASINSITLKWKAVEKATGYKIDNGVTKQDIGNVTTYTASNLKKNTKYSFAITAYNKGGDGKSTDAYTVCTLIDTPTEVTAASSNNRILIAWTGIPEATYYEVDLNGKIATTTSSAITIGGLNPSTAYKYKVRAKNTLTASAWSTAGKKTTLPNAPSIPTNILMSSTRSTTTISWNAITEATSYDIMMDSDLVIGISDTSYTITGLNPGSSHTYKVRARNAGGKSAWSDIQTKSTLAMEPNVPINLKSSIGTNCITVAWDEVFGAESYELEISSNITTASAITAASASTTTGSAITAFVDKDVTPDCTKVYRVRSISQGVQSDWSEAITVGFNKNNFGIPENLKGITSGSAIVLNWNSVSGATGYDLQVDGQIKSVGTKTSFTVTGLEPETIYTFRVRTRNEGGVGAWSSAISVETLPAALQIPSNFTAKATEYSITLFWNPLIDATSYDLELDGSTIQNVIGTTYSVEQLVQNSQHTYRIRARNENGVGDWSNALNITTLSFDLLTPQNFKAIASNNLIILTWDANPIASSYVLKIDGKTLETTADTQYIHTGLNPNEEHIYKIQSKKGAVYSRSSQALKISTLPNKPSIPNGIVVTTTGSAITVKYSSVADATGYDIQIDAETIDNGNSVSFTKIGLPDTQHSIRVRARNAGGTSDWSAEATVLIPRETPGIPTGIAINSTTEGAISVSWNALEGTSSYDIEADKIVISVGMNTEYKDTGLLPGTSHTYRIRANNEGGSGEWSSIVSKNTMLAVPQNLAANTSSGAIQLSWQKVEGSTAYELEIDGVATKITGTAFTQDTLPNQEHIYRVRAINTVTASEWSTSINAKLPMQVLSGKFGTGAEFEFEVGANNVKDINNVKFTIIYDPSQVDLVDLYSNTAEQNLSIGDIAGSKIKILQLAPGKIVLTVNDEENTGEYSGIIDTILFKSKKDGQVDITYSMNQGDN